MDLRDDPAWMPLTGVLTCGDWEVRLWTEPRLPGELTGDPHLVTLRGDRLRLAVADPAATCPDLTDQQVAWAGQTVVAALAAETDLVGAVNEAARRIHDPGLRPRLANPCAQVAAVDVELGTGRVTAVRAGDCQVWVRRRGARMFEGLLTGERLTPAAQEAFAAHPGAARAAGPRAHYAAHVDVLDDPAAWVTAPAGLDVPARTQVAEAVAEEVIVSSDGARLTGERCARLTGWLAGGLQVAPHDHAHPSPHGDVTVLHARRVVRAPALVHCGTCGVRLDRFPQFADGAGGEWLRPDGEVCCERPDPR